MTLRNVWAPCLHFLLMDLWFSGKETHFHLHMACLLAEASQPSSSNQEDLCHREPELVQLFSLALD